MHFLKTQIGKGIVLKGMGILSLWVGMQCQAQIGTSETLPIAEIDSLIVKNSPLHGANVPADIRFRLGAAHVAGKYTLTTSPFLLEGSEAIHNLGMGTIKLWFQDDPARDYPYHSDWNLSKEASLVDIAMHPYFKQVFDMPFQTFALSVRSEVSLQHAMSGSVTNYAEEEEAMYQLANYLLETYRDRQVVFILQNWEGDWLMRGGTGAEAQWTPASIPADIEKRSEVMINWFNARQAGVNRARLAAGQTNCKVYHAIEVNRVLDCRKGIPCLTSNILPYVKTDMVSWSCYDGLADPVDLWLGIDCIQAHMRPTGEFPTVPILIGEVGIPENEGSVFGIASNNGEILKEELIKRWDQAMAVFLARDIPYIIHWEVYCNEVKSGVQSSSEYTKDQMRGFWLIRPDGTESYAASYLRSLLENAGRSIKK